VWVFHQWQTAGKSIVAILRGAGSEAQSTIGGEGLFHVEHRWARQRQGVIQGT
jgi:hypothetical protein